MDLNLATLDEAAAEELVVQLLVELRGAREQVERSARRAAGIRKMIDAVAEMFPAVEDHLPADLDGDEDRPRGAEAVRRVLAQAKAEWMAVPTVVSVLSTLDWLPNSSNPANAVRSALERLVEAEVIEKGRTTEGVVIYRFRTPAPTYEYGEEPF